jgi:hypothetical protein
MWFIVVTSCIALESKEMQYSTNHGKLKYAARWTGRAPIESSDFDRIEFI